MTGLFMLAFSFALNTDTQKPHTHVFTSHMVVIVHLTAPRSSLDEKRPLDAPWMYPGAAL
jgi:hypothetical protein